ncbi:MAG: helix-turn-helix domain-containing protein [Opitutaceae bacterium]|jgi:AraC-like DNA-binding protein
MPLADQHNEIEINRVERGGLVFRRGEETVTLTEGQTVLYWAAVPHQVLTVMPGTEITWLVLPLSWFLSWKLEPAFVRRVLDEGLCSLEFAEGGVGSSLLDGWALDMSSDMMELRVAVRLEVEAFFRRLSVRMGDSLPVRDVALPRVPAVTRGNQCRHVERIVRYINSHFHEAITVGVIADAVQLNPEYAMRLFRSHWGMTIGEFLSKQRIAEARRMLLQEEDAGPTDVAFACGFQSISRFYQAFKRQCQCSPGAYRKRHVQE